MRLTQLKRKVTVSRTRLSRRKSNIVRLNGDKMMETGRGTRISTLSPAELLGPLNDVETRHAPPRLYAAGNFTLPLPRPRVALVGSRKASEEGLRVAGDIELTLAKNGVTVVSGLAEGIDTSAHLGAIKAGGRTIAVLGTPLDRVCPSKNAGLQETIMREHCAVSQFKMGSVVQKGNFVQRNLTMALIANASVVVEAGETSGSLRQALEALRLGRPLFIWHSVFTNRSLKWPKKMLDYGAIKLQRADAILPELPTSERVLMV